LVVELSGCGWAKFNVLQMLWLVYRLAALLILRRIGFLSSVACTSVDALQGRHSITGNVLLFGAVADFGAQNCQYTTKVDAR